MRIQTVEVKFRLKDDEMINELNQIMNTDKTSDSENPAAIKLPDFFHSRCVRKWHSTMFFYVDSRKITSNLLITVHISEKMV